MIRLRKAINVLGSISFVLLLSLGCASITMYKLSRSTMGISDTDRYFMDIAYDEAEKALEHGDVPVGAVLTMDQKLVAKAYNEVELKNDPKRHAEMIVIDRSLKILNKTSFKNMQNITLYATYEPCPMCEGYIVWKQVSRVVVGYPKNVGNLLKNNVLRHILYRVNERGGINVERQKGLFDIYKEKVKSKGL